MIQNLDCVLADGLYIQETDAGSVPRSAINALLGGLESEAVFLESL